MIEVESIIKINRTFYCIKGTAILHREDGPAVIWEDGQKEWFYKGARHRLDGPAVIHSDRTEEWWVNGRLHREDGPAIIYGDGDLEWYLDYNILSKEAWFEALTEEQKVKALYSEYFIRD
jgi:hypothetical protein